MVLWGSESHDIQWQGHWITPEGAQWLSGRVLDSRRATHPSLTGVTVL